MKQRRTQQQLLHVTFTRFGDAQIVAFRMLLSQTPLGRIFSTEAREGYHQVGRGLIVWLSTTGLMKDLRPPVYCGLEEWNADPLLINTPYNDLHNAMATYQPVREYIVLLVGTDPTAATHGQYAWWQQHHLTTPLVLP